MTNWRRAAAAAAIVGNVTAGAADAPALVLRTPEKGARVKISATREIAVPGDTAILARSGFDPVIFPPGQFDRTTLTTRGPLGVVTDGQIRTLSGLWSIGAAGASPRSTLGDREPFVILTSSSGGGYGSESVRAISLRKLAGGTGDEDALQLPTGLRSPLVLRSGIRLLATGYTYQEKTTTAVAGAPGIGEVQTQNLAVYAIGGSKPVMLAIIERMTEHAEDNLASAVTADGVLHMIATEVIVSKDNHSRVHHLRFDPANRSWLGDEVLFARSQFTSTIAPKVVAAGRTVDAFWLVDGGADRGASDGLYVRRIGESATWRLFDARGEYAILPNADGKGSMLVGVAINPSEDGRIRWFLRRGTKWQAAGETDLGVTVYTMTMTGGTEPFALWRDDTGVHAAFNADKKIVIADLQLPK